MRLKKLSNVVSFKNSCVLLLLGFTIYLCFRNYKLSREVEVLNIELHEISSTPDTLVLNKPYRPISKYPQETEPNRILLYADYKAKDTLSKANSYQATPQKSDSLVQFLLKRNQLAISLFNQKTNTYSTRLFKIDLDNYKYNWSDGSLTKKKVSRISLKPYLYGSYRPFNNLLDIGTGISIETKRFNYKFGINAFHYPHLKSGIGTDIEFKISYNYGKN